MSPGSHEQFRSQLRTLFRWSLTSSSANEKWSKQHYEKPRALSAVQLAPPPSWAFPGRHSNRKLRNSASIDTFSKPPDRSTDAPHPPATAEPFAHVSTLPLWCRRRIDASPLR